MNSRGQSSISVLMALRTRRTRLAALAASPCARLRSTGTLLCGAHLLENVPERKCGLRKCGQQRCDILGFGAYGAIHGELGSLLAGKEALHQKESLTGRLISMYGWARDEKVVGQTLPSTLDQLFDAVAQDAEEVLGWALLHLS